MSKPRCLHCATTTEELRPYGPKGAWVCFACAMSHKAETERAYYDQLDAAGPVAIIGEETGPRPFNRKPS